MNVTYHVQSYCSLEQPFEFYRMLLSSLGPGCPVYGSIIHHRDGSTITAGALGVPRPLACLLSPPAERSLQVGRGVPLLCPGHVSASRG